MRIYVAGPYSKGDIAVNVRKAIEAGDKLAELGHIPFVPHLTHLWHLVSPKPYDFWLKLDITILEQWAEALIRLPGESKGADMEVARAKELGIPVYYSLDDLMEVK